MSIKQKNGLLLAAVLSFCLGCQTTLCTIFQTFWRRNVVTSLVPAIFSASKPFLHTACFTHNQMFSLGRRQGSFGVMSLRTLLDTFSGWASDILLSMLPLLWKELPCMTAPVFPCSKGTSFLLEDSRHVTVVLSLFRLWGQFQVELLSRWPSKHSTGVRFHPCFCQLVCHCLHFALFLPCHTSKVDRRCSRGILGEFKLHKVPNCICFTKRLRGLSCLHKARPRLLNINCRHSF